MVLNHALPYNYHWEEKHREGDEKLKVEAKEEDVLEAGIYPTWVEAAPL